MEESQGSQWVVREKKLKQKLQELFDQQQQQEGKNLCVPILTRWLGDHIPIYITLDMDVNVKQWKKQVQDKYAGKKGRGRLAKGDGQTLLNNIVFTLPI
jgi:hypothetical protein